MSLLPLLVRRALVALIAAAGLWGCNPRAPEPDMALPPDDLALPPPLCSDPVPPDGGLPPTLGNVQKLFNQGCLYSCHCCSNEVDLNPGHAYANLVNVPAPATATTGDITCGGLLVKPFDPAGSYLYQKLTMSSPCFGSQMPLELGNAMLPECQIDLVRRWILAGAPND